MNITVTLIGQIITFAFFVWFTMKLVWPPIIKALDERKKTIADGLAAADRGKLELESARKQVKQLLNEARGEASIIIEKANERAHRIEEDAVLAARNLAERVKRKAEADMHKQFLELRNESGQEVAHIALMGAEQLIEHNIDKKSNQKLLDDLTKEMRSNEAA